MKSNKNKFMFVFFGFVVVWIASILAIGFLVVVCGLQSISWLLSLDYCFGGIIVICMFFVIYILAMKRGIHNLNKCGDNLFNEIDEYKKGWNEDNNSYYRCIQKMKILYMENGEIDKLLNKNEIDRLFKRKSFLDKRKHFYSNMLNSLSSLTLSMIVSGLFCQSILKNEITALFAILGIVFCFFLIAAFPFIKRGEDGSFEFCLIDIELDLIEKKITEYYDKERILNEKALDTQQVAINVLSDIVFKQKKKEKQKIIADIEIIEQLDLSYDEKIENVKIREIKIGEKIGYLAYNKELARENNYIGNHHLLSEDYSKLVEILEKYKIVQYL